MRSRSIWPTPSWCVARLGDEPVDMSTIRAYHTGYFCELVREAAQAFGGQGEPGALARVDMVLADVRAALGYAVEQDPVRAMHMVGALGGYWLRRRLHGEGRRWTIRAFEASQAVSDRAARAAVLHVAGSLDMWRELDDRRAIGRTLNNLAGVASDSGNQDCAYRRWQEVLEVLSEAGDDLGVAGARTNLGIAAKSWVGWKPPPST